MSSKRPRCKRRVDRLVNESASPLNVLQDVALVELSGSEDEEETTSEEEEEDSEEEEEVTEENLRLPSDGSQKKKKKQRANIQVLEGLPQTLERDAL